MAAGLGILAVLRLVVIDTPLHPAGPFTPIFNKYALPALGVTACVLGAVIAARRFVERLVRAEEVLFALVGITGLLLLWLVLSRDTWAYFDQLALTWPQDATRWRWFGQTALSALWATYATAGHLRNSIHFVSPFARAEATAQP